VQCSAVQCSARSGIFQFLRPSFDTFEFYLDLFLVKAQHVSASLPCSRAPLY
jgi:hypothetical protein